MMKRYMGQVLFYILIGAIIVYCLDWMSAVDYSAPSMMLREMYQREENINTLFLGSSHTQRSYDPQIADKILGGGSFNAGSSAQLLITSYYLLREVEKQNDLETVVLDTFFGISEKNFLDEEYALYLSDYMDWSWNKIEYLWKASGLRGIENGIVYRYTRNLNGINIKERIKAEKITVDDYDKANYYLNNTGEYRGMGFVYGYKSEEDMNFKKEAEQFDLTAERPMSDDSYAYLINIIEYCNENGIKLVLVDQPMPDEFLSEVKGYDNYVAFLSQLSDKYGVDYMNFNLYKGYEKSLNDYRDCDHLNGSGAEKYTEVLCNTFNALKSTDKTLDDFFDQEYLPANILNDVK